MVVPNKICETFFRAAKGIWVYIPPILSVIWVWSWIFIVKANDFSALLAVWLGGRCPTSHLSSKLNFKKFGRWSSPLIIISLSSLLSPDLLAMRPGRRWLLSFFCFWRQSKITNSHISGLFDSIEHRSNCSSRTFGIEALGVNEHNSKEINARKMPNNKRERSGLKALQFSTATFLRHA